MSQSGLATWDDERKAKQIVGGMIEKRPFLVDQDEFLLAETCKWVGADRAILLCADDWAKGVAKPALVRHAETPFGFHSSERALWEAFLSGCDAESNVTTSEPRSILENPVLAIASGIGNWSFAASIYEYMDRRDFERSMKALDWQGLDRTADLIGCGCHDLIAGRRRLVAIAFHRVDCGAFQARDLARVAALARAWDDAVDDLGYQFLTSRKRCLLRRKDFEKDEEIIKGLLRGESHRKIAERVNLSPERVRHRATEIFSRFDVADRKEFVRLFIDSRLSIARDAFDEDEG